MNAMDDATKFTIHLSIGVLIALLLILSMTLPRYEHPAPATDCKPYDYPTCQRSTEPATRQEPGLQKTFLAVALTASLALILAYASYHACVIEQAEIITPTAAVKSDVKPATTASATSVSSTSVSATSASSATVSSTVAPIPAAPSAKTTKETVRSRTEIEVRPNTDVTIIPPKGQPSKGVDVRDL